VKLKRENELKRNCESESSKKVDEKESESNKESEKKKVSERKKESEKNKECEKKIECEENEWKTKKKQVCFYVKASHVKNAFYTNKPIFVLLYKKACFNTNKLDKFLPSVVVSLLREYEDVLPGIF
jgi:hypothetical protein